MINQWRTVQQWNSSRVPEGEPEFCYLGGFQQISTDWHNQKRSDTSQEFLREKIEYFGIPWCFDINFSWRLPGTFVEAWPVRAQSFFHQTLGTYWPNMTKYDQTDCTYYGYVWQELIKLNGILFLYPTFLVFGAPLIFSKYHQVTTRTGHPQVIDLSTRGAGTSWYLPPDSRLGNWRKCTGLWNGLWNGHETKLPWDVSLRFFVPISWLCRGVESRISRWRPLLIWHGDGDNWSKFDQLFPYCFYNF